MIQQTADPRAEFIDFMGRALEAEGLSPISGRILGLLMFDGRAFSFSDLARELGISRGSVSANARLLVARGAIEKFNLPGDRQDYFRISDSPSDGVLQGVCARMNATARDVRGIAAALSDDAAGPRARLLGFADFYAAVAEGIERAAERMQRH